MLSSLVGLGAALQLLLLRDDRDFGDDAKFFGVWAMVLSWMLLHWGFAQVYRHLDGRRGSPDFAFPASAEPTIVDYAYFAYTVGTSFAVSDVETRSSSIRWLVVVHGVLSFFFNGLIVVLALNTIMSAG